jgi:CheY-like chemotaxis protein
MLSRHATVRAPRRARAVPKILIADDDVVFRELISEIVLAGGWSVIPAADAMQTVMFTVRGEPSAIILDINMPGGSGLSALQRLRQNVRTEHIPVIVVTGAIEPGIEARARQLGATAFLPKPVDPAILRSTIATALADVDQVH